MKFTAPLSLALGLSVSAIALSAFSSLACESLESDPPPAAPLLPISTAPPLPSLSPAEITQIQADLTFEIDTWFGLAGVAKAPAPPRFSDAHQDYQAQWSQIDPDIAPFLGFWHNSADYPYTVGIFPSATPGEVCVLEFQPEWSLQILNEATGEYNKDVISEQILSFSRATVQDGHFRSGEMRTVGSAIALARYSVGEAYPVLFMGLQDEAGTVRVVAAADPSAFPDSLPLELVGEAWQTLADQGCERPDIAPLRLL